MLPRPDGHRREAVYSDPDVCPAWWLAKTRAVRQIPDIHLDEDALDLPARHATISLGHGHVMLAEKPSSVGFSSRRPLVAGQLDDGLVATMADGDDVGTHLSMSG